MTLAWTLRPMYTVSGASYIFCFMARHRHRIPATRLTQKKSKRTTTESKTNVFSDIYRDLCEQALDEAPESRFASVDDFITALDAIPDIDRQRRALGRCLAVCLIITGLAMMDLLSSAGLWRGAFGSTLDGLNFRCMVERDGQLMEIGKDVLPTSRSRIRLSAETQDGESIRFYICDPALRASSLVPYESYAPNHYVYPSRGRFGIRPRSGIRRLALLAGTTGDEKSLPLDEEISTDFSCLQAQLPDSVAAVSFSSSSRANHGSTLPRRERCYRLVRSIRSSKCVKISPTDSTASRSRSSKLMMRIDNGSVILNFNALAQMMHEEPRKRRKTRKDSMLIPHRL